MRRCAHIIGPSPSTQVALRCGVCGHVDNWCMQKCDTAVQRRPEGGDAVRTPISEDVECMGPVGEKVVDGLRNRTDSRTAF